MGSLSKRSPRHSKGRFQYGCPWRVVHIPQSPETQKKCRSTADLGDCMLATRGDVQYNMLAERGANKSDGRDLGSSTAEWSMTSWRGTDATKSRDEECASKSSVVRTYSEGVVCVVRARRPTGGTKSLDGECAPKREVSSARSWKVSSVWYVPGDQQEGPLPSHCCCGRRCRRKGAPSIEKPPEKEQGLWARWQAEAKSLRKNTPERLEERWHNSKSSFRRRHLYG